MVSVTRASVTLFSDKPLIKLVPTRYDKDLPHFGDVVSIQINTCKTNART